MKCYISKSSSFTETNYINLLNNMKPVYTIGNKILDVILLTFPNIPIICVYNKKYSIHFLGYTVNGMLFVQYMLNSHLVPISKRFVLIS